MVKTDFIPLVRSKNGGLGYMDMSKPPYSYPFSFVGHQLWIQDPHAPKRKLMVLKYASKMVAIMLFEAILCGEEVGHEIIDEFGKAYLSKINLPSIKGEKLYCPCSRDEICHADSILAISNGLPSVNTGFDYSQRLQMLCINVANEL